MSTETGNHQGNKDPRLKEASTTEEPENIVENLRENHRSANREANSQISCLIMKKQGLDIVEMSSRPLEAEEGPTSQL
jgi:hypothetical protein